MMKILHSERMLKWSVLWLSHIDMELALNYSVLKYEFKCIVHLDRACNGFYAGEHSIQSRLYNYTLTSDYIAWCIVRRHWRREDMAPSKVLCVSVIGWPWWRRSVPQRGARSHFFYCFPMNSSIATSATPSSCFVWTEEQIKVITKEALCMHTIHVRRLYILIILLHILRPKANKPQPHPQVRPMWAIAINRDEWSRYFQLLQHNFIRWLLRIPAACVLIPVHNNTRFSSRLQACKWSLFNLRLNEQRAPPVSITQCNQSLASRSHHIYIYIQEL